MNDARAFLSEGQIELLRQELRAEIERHPDWLDLRHLSGLLHALTGDLDAAHGAFREALLGNRDYADAQWSLRWAELLRGDVPAGGPDGDARLEVLRGILQGAAPDPGMSRVDAATAFFLLAAAATRRDQPAMDRAVQRLRELDAGLPAVLDAAGLANAGTPDPVRLAELGRPILLNPGHAALLERAARIDAMSGDDKEALRLFAVAALLTGSRARFLLYRAELAGRAGDASECVRCLREAVDLEPEWHAPHASLGYELSVLDRREEALHHLGIAVRLRPGYADVLYQYALLLHADRRNDEACEQLEAALRINPRYHAARAALANVLFEAGREKESLPHYEVLLEEGIESTFLLGRLGYAAHAAGYRDRAEELFLRAIGRHRDRPDLLCLYGMFLAETERVVEARAVWDRALNADPPRDLRERVESLRDGAGRPR
jgi:tetratricopeptide (TPR) repeat protein